MSRARRVTRSRPADAPRSARKAKALLPSPTTDSAELMKLGSQGRPLTQYLAWADRLGVFSFLARRRSSTVAEVARNTRLNERGAETLVCMLASLGVLSRSAQGTISLTKLAREYLVADSPYYLGPTLYMNQNEDVPERMTTGKPIRVSTVASAPEGGGALVRGPRAFGSMERLTEQHARNFAGSVVAARKIPLRGVRHVVDIAGGSGTFSIPVALDHPEIKVTLVELPHALPNIRKILRRYGVEKRIELVGMDIFQPWTAFPDCGGVFIGNMFHALGDDECNILCREAMKVLVPGGSLWLHERLWAPRKDGPVLTALYNMLPGSATFGGQRTERELKALLSAGGFRKLATTETLGGFHVISGRKP
jgi:O-methyltransferase domain/Dimerisation domain